MHVLAYFPYGVRQGHPDRARILDSLNEFQVGTWAPQRVYLDKDGDLCLAWSLNIPGSSYPVHAEQVADAVVRTAMGWKQLYEHLKASGVPLPRTRP